MVVVRRSLAIGALGVLAAIGVSCVAIVGADEKWQSAAVVLCGCQQLLYVEACVTTVEGRLEGASDTTRAAWLSAAEERGCFADCDRSVECFRTAPTCSSDICSEDNDCCAGMSCKATDTGTMECL